MSDSPQNSKQKIKRNPFCFQAKAHLYLPKIPGKKPTAWSEPKSGEILRISDFQMSMICNFLRGAEKWEELRGEKQSSLPLTRPWRLPHQAFLFGGDLDALRRYFQAFDDDSGQVDPAQRRQPLHAQGCDVSWFCVSFWRSKRSGRRGGEEIKVRIGTRQTFLTRIETRRLVG